MRFSPKEVRWPPRNKTYRPVPPGEKDSDSEYSVGPSLEDQPTASTPTDCEQPKLGKGLRLVLIGGGTLLVFFLGLLIAGSLIVGTAPDTSYANIHSTSTKQHFMTPQPWNDSTPSPCGSTIESARAAGCQWSSMIWAWFPAACYDRELEQEFLNESDWEWFSTRDLRPESKLSREAILRGDEPKAYVTGHYHKFHCAYAFKKLFRSVLGVSMGDNYLLTMGHMHHCEGNMLTDGWGTTAGVAKWLDCVAI